MAAGIRIIARRMTSAAVPWIGALIAARRAKPAVGPLALISGVWIGGRTGFARSRGLGELHRASM
jgi:hypothetical protein